jgi:hypothetical protein
MSLNKRKAAIRILVVIFLVFAAGCANHTRNGWHAYH